MSDKTILVTGGAGFIGSNFARHLYRKYPEYRILVVDALTYAGSVSNLPEGAQQSGRYEFWYGDVRNGELMDTLVSRADVVVHMAAESHVTRSIYDNRLFFETDVLGTQTVANASPEPAEPLCLGQVRGRQARLLLLGDLSDSGGDRAALQQLRTVPAPGKGGPALHHLLYPRRAHARAR